MTNSASMTWYQKHLYNETQKVIASTRCKICQKPIGQHDYLSFEERYFHAKCLKRPTLEHYSTVNRRQT
jgi:hypothetical protein